MASVEIVDKLITDVIGDKLIPDVIIEIIRKNKLYEDVSLYSVENQALY